MDLSLKEQRCQKLGITAHIILDTCLHLSLARVDDLAVNGAAVILPVDPIPWEGQWDPKKRRVSIQTS